MVREEKTSRVRIHRKLKENYLDKIREILARNREVEMDEISYAEASLDLAHRLDNSGGLKENQSLKSG